MLFLLERVPLSVEEKIALIGFGDSTYVYICESKVWLWYFIVKQNNRPNEGLDELFDRVVEHRFDVKQYVVHMYMAIIIIILMGFLIPRSPSLTGFARTSQTCFPGGEGD